MHVLLGDVILVQPDAYRSGRVTRPLPNPGGPL